MKNRTLILAPLTIAASALLLAACGSGGGDGGSGSASDPLVAGTDVPTSATTSSAGAMAFIRRVVAMTDLSASPLVIGDVTLGTSETDEPEPI